MSAHEPTVGVIGLRYGRAHIPAFQANGCRVVAVCQRDQAGAKAVADRYGIAPGAEIAFEPAGDVIRVVHRRAPARGSMERARLFERVLARQRERESDRTLATVEQRGWTREDLYDRGRAR